MKRYKTIFQVRRGTSEQWDRINPILRTGEPGYATDTAKLKIGNGIDHWKDLPVNDSFLLSYDSREDFPEAGLSEILYRDKGSAQLYQWNEETSSYEILSSIKGLEALLDKKVDKEEGKGLSSNDFTTELKNKLETMSSTPGTIYVHNQMTSSKEWVITHNLGHFPSVSVVDSAGTVVVGEVNYIDQNTIIVSFSGAFSGKAYLN